MIRYLLVGVLIAIAACGAPDTEQAHDTADRESLPDTDSEPSQEWVVSEDYVELSNETLESIIAFIPGEPKQVDTVRIEVYLRGVPEGAQAEAFMTISDFPAERIFAHPVRYTTEVGHVVEISLDPFEYQGDRYVPFNESFTFDAIADESFRFEYSRE